MSEFKSKRLSKHRLMNNDFTKTVTYSSQGSRNKVTLQREDAETFSTLVKTMALAHTLAARHVANHTRTPFYGVGPTPSSQHWET